MTNRLSRQKIAAAIARLIEDGQGPELARRIAAYLIDQGRLKELDSLMRDIIRIRAEQGMVEVNTTSAFPLTKEIKMHVRQLAAEMQGGDVKQVMTNEIIDPGVLGGVRIETPNEQIDLTVRARLDQLKQLTAEGTRHGPIS